MIEYFADVFSNYTLRTVILGTSILGIVSGALGVFAYLRKQSLVGGVVSHSALPGIVIAFLITGSKAPSILVLGAAIAGWLSMLLVNMITRTTRVKYDSALGIILALFFGTGILLLIKVQMAGMSKKAGLEHYLFGMAATMSDENVLVIGGLGGLALMIMFVFWKEFKVASFDPDYTKSIGFSVHLIDTIITSLIVVAIVIGLEAVGVILMSAMIIIPASAARQWTNRLSLMVLISAFIGAMAGVGGTLAGDMGKRLATGPLIVLAATVLFIVSLFLAPKRGMAIQWIRQRKRKRRVMHRQILALLYNLMERSKTKDNGWTIDVIKGLSPYKSGINRTLNHLKVRELVQQANNLWLLTQKGVDYVRLDSKDHGGHHGL